MRSARERATKTYLIMDALHRAGYTVKPEDLRKVLRLIRTQGALTIRDIDDDVLVEKDHAWASRKPSKRALQLAFYRGQVTVSRREGMLKTYELPSRHFGWERPPKAASERCCSIRTNTST